MKVVLITGGARGIGRATAERFLAAGHKVVVTDKSAEALEPLRQSFPERSAVIEQDISERTAPDDAVRFALDRFGRLDVLVNNAGIGGANPDITKETEEGLDDMLNINLRAHIRFCQIALPALGAGACIVNVASIVGLRGNAGNGVYSIAKAGIVGLTRQLAADYGPLGIRVNAVAPGLIETPMTRDKIRANPAFQAQLINRTPFPRIGCPEDIANAVYFLASDEAGFVNGHVLVVDGGWLTANGGPIGFQ
ncbi:SDR family oxidoreductase [Ochrobactrum sp. Q0168]|uniref:SDR family NAD(P)-dependent oxidoreductase n=1 Tax=Ochrobactrum sp. Q0168 TaxID=2793241 RepID=UPI0018EA7C2D|nr:SDR family oxidoreductase [Ochrobactrum sp. Q0168]